MSVSADTPSVPAPVPPDGRRPRAYDESLSRWEMIAVGLWAAAMLVSLVGLPATTFPAHLVFIALLWRPVRDAVRGVVQHPGALLWGLLAFAGMIASSVVGDIITQVLSQVFGLGVVTSANEADLAARVAAAPVTMALLMVVIGPLQEELFYRYGIVRIVGRRNTALGHAGSALLFGLQHVVVALIAGDLTQVVLLPGYVLSGLVLSLVYARSRNLLAPYLGHALANGLGLALLLGR